MVYEWNDEKIWSAIKEHLQNVFFQNLQCALACCTSEQNNCTDSIRYEYDWINFRLHKVESKLQLKIVYSFIYETLTENLKDNDKKKFSR